MTPNRTASIGEGSPIRSACIVALVVSVILIGTVLAEEESEYLVTERWIQGYSYTSDTSITGIGLTNVYYNYNILNESKGKVLSLKTLRSGSGVYNHDFVEVNQNSIETDEDGEYELSNYNIENVESTSAAQADTSLGIPGSFKSNHINLPWRDSSFTANYPGSVIMDSQIDDAKVFDKELTIIMYSDVEDIDQYNEYEGLGDLGFGSSLDLKASFDGMGHIGMRFNNSIRLDEDYRGSFTVSKKLTADIRKVVDSGDYDSDFDDYPWLPCCTGGYFDMSLFDRNYINPGIFT